MQARTLPRTIVILLMAAAAPGAAEPDEQKTVRVDCAKGHSIQRALEDKADELILEIRGICHEDVEIRRDHVTLRGGSPQADGVEGVGAGDSSGDAVILIRGARNVRLESLSVRHGSRNGIVAIDSFPVHVTECELVHNTRYGLYAGTDSTLFATDVGVQGGIAGIGGFGFIHCTRCTISDATVAATFGGASGPLIEDSSLSGDFGVWTSNAAFITVRGSTIEGASFALLADTSAHLAIRDSHFTGSILLQDKGEADLRDVVQTAAGPAGSNTVHGDSLLRVQGTSALVGAISVEEFGKLVLRGSATIGGNLACTSGGEAYCDNPAAILGTVNGCGHCIEP